MNLACKVEARCKDGNHLVTRDVKLFIAKGRKREEKVGWLKSVIGPRPWKRRVLPFPWNYRGPDFSESGNLALSEQRARRCTTPATSTKSGSANASRKQRRNLLLRIYDGRRADRGKDRVRVRESETRPGWGRTKGTLARRSQKPYERSRREKARRG